MTREDPVRAAAQSLIDALPYEPGSMLGGKIAVLVAALAASPADGAGPQSVFYDGAHDDCPYDYRHNHSTAPLRDALTLGEHALVDAVLRADPMTREDPVSRIELIGQAIHQYEDPHLEGVSLRQIGLARVIDAALAASPADGAGVDVERLRRQAALDARVRDAALDIEPSSPEPQWTEFRTLRNRAARAALEGASDGHGDAG